MERGAGGLGPKQGRCAPPAAGCCCRGHVRLACLPSTLNSFPPRHRFRPQPQSHYATASSCSSPWCSSGCAAAAAATAAGTLSCSLARVACSTSRRSRASACSACGGGGGGGVAHSRTAPRSAHRTAGRPAALQYPAAPGSMRCRHSRRRPPAGSPRGPAPAAPRPSRSRRRGGRPRPPPRPPPAASSARLCRWRTGCRTPPACEGGGAAGAVGRRWLRSALAPPTRCTTPPRKPRTRCCAAPPTCEAGRTCS
jgi:hypothetical protein